MNESGIFSQLWKAAYYVLQMFNLFSEEAVEQSDSVCPNTPNIVPRGLSEATLAERLFHSR